MANKPHQAKVLFEGKEFVSESFGISEKRNKELKDIIFLEIFTNIVHKKDIADILETITSKVDNINESIYIAFHYGRMLAERDNFLDKIIGDIDGFDKKIKDIMGGDFCGDCNGCKDK